MLLDADRGLGRELPRYDVCIIGAGAAGITLALELEAAGRRVCLVEAGGTGYEAATQRLMEGQVAGHPYPLLRDTRVAALGGSTAVWAGYCRPLDALDFERGWPFGLDELRPYYARAHAICGLGDFDYRPDRWAGVLGTGRLLDGDAAFANQIFHVNNQNFGERYRDRLERAKTIDLVLHAPVTRLRMEGRVCAAATVHTLGGHTFEVGSERFVLAAGGVENPRLLLLSTAEGMPAPGNAYGMVGRYFSDHLFVDPGWLVLKKPDSLEYYRSRQSDSTLGASVRGALSLRREAVERAGLMNASLFIHPRYESHQVFASDEVKAFLQVWNKLKRRGVPGAMGPGLMKAAKAPHRIAIAMARKLAVGDGPARRWRMRASFETAFRHENRVMLGDETDPLGRRAVRIEWRIGDEEVENMRRVMRHFDEALRRAGAGRFEPGFSDEPAAWRRGVEGGKHHMGTTRMHVSPEHGVVDEQGKVHGAENLFVTGSSVFPTGGYANPTLTIVALAVRLGARLAESG
jgi:choline dehydrogenase-like flavoprotein